jgi:hypothetical protein
MYPTLLLLMYMSALDAKSPSVFRVDLSIEYFIEPRSGGERSEDWANSASAG